MIRPPRHASEASSGAGGAAARRLCRALALAALLPLAGGCERASAVLESVRETLDRETAVAETGPADIPPPPEPVKMEPAIDKEARVSVLGYHDFTEGLPGNDMMLNIGDFRKQMQAIADAELPVISMREFLDWRRGKANIPRESVMITIDDGWKATHTLALDVLVEFGYPFTLFLYKNYVDVGGRSLTREEIREIAAAGGTIGSHSVSHRSLSQRDGRSPAAYEAWLREELEESYRFLEEEFGDTGAVVKVFAYPYGVYNDRVVELAREFGYEACFTVDGRKTDWDTDLKQVGRYVVHATTLANFDPALDFGDGSVVSAGRSLLTERTSADGASIPPAVSVSPAPNSLVAERLPLVEIDLSRLDGVQPESISLRITGFGKVPHRYDAETGRVSYRIPQRLRLESCGVQLSFRHAGKSDNEVIGWTFQVDRLADYLSNVEVGLEEPPPAGGRDGVTGAPREGAAGSATVSEANASASP